MTDWQCSACRAQVAPGAPRCPQCPSTSFDMPEAEMTLKITRDGSVTDSADVQPFSEQLADVSAALAEANAEHPGTGEPMTGIEHPADGTSSPEISNGALDAPEAEQVTQLPPGELAQPEPAAVPVMPPRRTPPPAAPGD